MPTKQDLIEEVHRLDPELSENDQSFRVALILLAALEVGADVPKIAEFLGMSESYIRKFEANLRQNGVWDGEVTEGNWFDPEDGKVEFWCDVSVAIGHLKRSMVE